MGRPGRGVHGADARRTAHAGRLRPGDVSSRILDSDVSHPPTEETEVTEFTAEHRRITKTHGDRWLLGALGRAADEARFAGRAECERGQMQTARTQQRLASGLSHTSVPPKAAVGSPSVRLR